MSHSALAAGGGSEVRHESADEDQRPEPEVEQLPVIEERL
jgi:hypothetical protein